VKSSAEQWRSAANLPFKCVDRSGDGSKSARRSIFARSLP
jgi:hypothetical protein